MAASRGAIRSVSIMPLRGDRFAVKGTERFEQVVVDYIGLELLLNSVSGAEGVRVPEVEVDLDEGGVVTGQCYGLRRYGLRAGPYMRTA